MINDSKEDFLAAINIKAEEWRNRSYEEYVTGFLTKTIKQSTTLNIPKNTPLDTKEHIFKESSATIAQTAKKIVNNALLDDQNTLHNVDIAHEISNPNNFSESVQKLLAEHIYNEANDKVAVLEAEFDSGEFNNFSSEKLMDYIEGSFESINFDDRFNNGKNLKKQMDMLLSLEGESVINSIKDDINKLVTETEAKNSVIRDTVTQINEKREEIEKKVNGDDSVDPNADNAEEVGDTAKKEDKKEEQASEGFYGRALRQNKKYNKSDLYSVYDMRMKVDLSTESLERTFDENSFSREEAEQILQEFQELDGIDTASIPDNEDALSVSCADADVPGGGGNQAESSENTYVNDDGNTISVDEEKFKFDEDDYKAKEYKDGEDDDDDDDSSDNESEDNDDDFLDFDDDESEESMAKDFMPLSFEKLHNRSIKTTPKLAAYLAFTKDGGKLFFDEVGRRSAEMYNLLSKEDSVADNVNKDVVNREIETKVEEVTTVKEDTERLMNDFGILGILSGDFQRNDSPTHNATVALFNPKLLTPKDSKDISKEELHEHELVNILKIGMNIGSVKNDIAKGADVQGNRDKLGYLEELLNEKMFKLDPSEKIDIEQKIGALQSIESIISIDDAINMKVFASKSAGTDNSEKITINSLKDIDAYGYSFDDEISKIKKNVEKNFKDKFEGKYNVVNFDIMRLVDFVVDEVDTTKLDTNLFESILSKIVDKIDVTKSSEGLIVLNKARALTTSFVTADKLGLLSKDELRNIKASLIC